MRKLILNLIFTILSISAPLTWSMQNPHAQDYITLQDATGTAIGTLSKDLLPFSDLSHFGNRLMTYINPSFIPLLKSLLYAQQTMDCIEKPYLKCTRDIKQILLKKSSPNLQAQFLSWFELLYLMDMFNVPASVQDPLIAHIAGLIKDHEQEAADQTAAIIDNARIVSLIAIWRKVASFYQALFGHELEIEGLQKSGMSIQALLMLGKIDPMRLLLKQKLNEQQTRMKFDAYLDLSNLNISSLEGWLYLNTLITDKVLRTFLKDLDINLKKIKLSNNPITSIPSDFLSNAPNLKKLDLQGCLISTLPDTFLKKSRLLQDLFLGNNNLVTLPTTFLTECPFISTLTLNNNKIIQLPDGFLDNNTFLRGLKLDNNQLKKLPTNFLAENTDLSMLILSNNQVMELENSFLSNNTFLTILNLDNNQLSSLPDSFLYACNKLKYVGLANNNLVELPSNLFINNTLLEGVHVENNQLAFLPATFLINSPHLKFLYIKNRDGSYPRNNLPLAAKIAFERVEQINIAAAAKKRRAENDSDNQPPQKKQNTQQVKQ